MWGIVDCTGQGFVVDAKGDCCDDEDVDDAHVGREGEWRESLAAPGKVLSLMLKVIVVMMRMLMMLMLVVRGNVGNRGLHRGRLCR